MRLSYRVQDGHCHSSYVAALTGDTCQLRELPRSARAFRALPFWDPEVVWINNDKASDVGCLLTA
jgi:hypothetical protein